MRKLILDHFDDDDIQKLNLKRDITSWNSELDSIHQDVHFLGRLIAALRTKRKDFNSESLGPLKTQLQESEEANQEYLDRIIEYRNKIERINECQDMQCEKFFLNNHEDFRDILEEHATRFRTLKQQIYKLFSGRMEVHLA